MKNLYNLFRSSFLLLCILAIVKPDAYSQNIFPEDSWGVYSWTQFTQIDKNSAPLVKGGPIIMRWANLEPQNGVYDFDNEIKDKLTKALDNGFHVFLKIYLAGPSFSYDNGFTPSWLYDNGVPEVHAERGIFPYYFDDDYKFYYYRLIDAFGAYILNLPDDLRSRILFVQCTEGSTGDGYCYKGDVDIEYEQYNISREDWSIFRLEAWKKFKAAFSENNILQIPLLTNDDANNPALRSWMLDELPKAIGVKNGMFTHGYQISEAQERLALHFQLKEQAAAKGKVFFARGEMDAEMNEKGWITQNKKQGLYWSGIYATHCGISMWNIIQDAVKGNEYKDAMNFFNKYAGQFNPEDAKGAFIAFYRGLDASDVSAFPVSTYGIAEKSNTQRYINICNAFSQYGANMADAAAATGGGMTNRDASGYNDAGWQILKENFQRHISQIDAEETSAAWWQIDASVYGRFARGFEHSSGKDTVYLDIDDDFFTGKKTEQKSNIKFKVIYLASDPGSWSLKYHAFDGTMKTACSVTNSGLGWETKEVTIDGALLNNGGSRGADFILENNGGTDCRFHLIEIDKSQIVYGTVIRQTIKASAGTNGSISPEGDVMVLEGEDQSFSITPKIGCEVDSVTVDGVGQGAITSYTFTDVTSTHTIHATFKERTGGINLIKNGDFSNSTSYWQLELKETSTATLTNDSGEAFVDITEDDGTNWHVNLNQGNITLINGHNYTLSFDARAQADRDIILKCASDGGSGGNSYGNTRKSITSSTTKVSHNWTHETLTEEYKFSIFCGAEGVDNDVWFDNFFLIDNTGVITYTILASAGSNGNIDPDGGVLVNEFENQSFTMTPDNGYEVDDVTVDGKSVGAVTSYTFSNVIANHTINAIFKEIVVIQNTITASAGSNGSISPSGAVLVNESENQSFTITPDNGYEVDDVTVDGTSQGAITSYTFNNVTTDHTIVATFKLITTDVNNLIDNGNFQNASVNLVQISPNPFHTITTVSYQLPQQSHVSLQVYNMYGQQVATLFDGYLSEGFYEQTWHAIDSKGNMLQSGNYFIRFVSGNTVKTMMALLMK